AGAAASQVAMKIVLDSGALIALEDAGRDLWAMLKVSGLRSWEVIVPSTVVAQVWRGKSSQARLASALQHCVIASFDAMPRRVGELCAKARTKDICDAHVALVATSVGDVLYTSDVADLEALIQACR